MIFYFPDGVIKVVSSGLLLVVLLLNFCDIF